jgi:hypothetical protein
MLMLIMMAVVAAVMIVMPPRVTVPSDVATPQDFAIRWSGFFKPSMAGVYTFSVALSTTNTADEWFSFSIDAAPFMSRDPSFTSITTTGRPPITPARPGPHPLMHLRSQCIYCPAIGPILQD